jgi:hypothetical protein
MIRSTRRNSRLIANYSRVIIYMKNFSIRSVILSKYTANKNEMQNFDIIFGCIIQMTEMSNLFISHVFFACKWQWIWFCIIFSCVLLISIIVWFLLQLKKKHSWVSKTSSSLKNSLVHDFSKLYSNPYTITNTSTKSQT